MLAPLQGKDIFIAEDFEFLESLDMDAYARKVRNKVSLIAVCISLGQVVVTSCLVKLKYRFFITKVMVMKIL